MLAVPARVVACGPLQAAALLAPLLAAVQRKPTALALTARVHWRARCVLRRLRVDLVEERAPAPAWRPRLWVQQTAVQRLHLRLAA